MYSSYNLLLSKTSFSQYQNNALVSEEPDFLPYNYINIFAAAESL